MRCCWAWSSRSSGRLVTWLSHWSSAMPVPRMRAAFSAHTAEPLTASTRRCSRSSPAITCRLRWFTDAVARRVVILGSTGSIGVQALDVISRSAGELRVVGLSAQHAWEPLLEQARAHGVRRIALADPGAAARASEAWTDGSVLSGPDGIVQLIAET